MRTIVLLSHHPFVHALGWSLLHFLWQGAAITILLATVLGLLRGRSPQARYAASFCALLLMAILPLATFVRLAAGGPGAEIRMASSSMDRSAAQNLDSAFGSTQPWLDELAGGLDRFVPWILCVWCAGVILLLSRLNLGLIAARRLKSAGTQPAAGELQSMLRQLSRRFGVKRTIQLANSALVQVPTVVGWLRPAILMRLGCLMGLSTSQVEAVLAHELAHIRRHDYLVSVFQSGVETLLFYHPGVWWVSQQVRQEREHCCDDFAVRISGDTLAYAKALSFLEERRTSVPMVALGANGGVLAMRIERLLGYKETPVVSRLAVITVLASICVTTGLLVSTIARAASQQAATDRAQGLPAKYQKWLDEDVVWIITREERAAFTELKGDEERDKFVEQFWERRNPTPGSSENAAKDAHYQRIAYANLHFTTASVPGWKTDRGRIYIVYGPPDEIESHPAKSGPTKPTEFWRYHSILEHGVERKNVDMKFVDISEQGDYRLESPANN